MSEKVQQTQKSQDDSLFSVCHSKLELAKKFHEKNKQLIKGGDWISFHQW